MFKKIRANKTTLSVNTSYIGETIEEKVDRIINNKEPIKDGAPLIYTERKDGVLPDYNIRTDRFDVAIDAMDRVSKDKIAKREAKMEPLKGGKDDKKDGGAEPLQATDKK